MKITSNLQGRGKLGTEVFTQRAGVTIARQYVDKIANPSTDAQVEQRSRFKLISQLAAALSSSIVIPKEGLKSARNIFTSINMPFVYGSDEGAIVSYENLQLTKSNLPLPAIQLARADGNLTIKLDATTPANVDRVVYNVYKKTDDDMLAVIGSEIVKAVDSDGSYTATIPVPDVDVVVFAYGVTDKNESATMKYNNYKVETGQDFAGLLNSRSLNAANYQFTMTRGTTIFAGENANAQSSGTNVLIYATASGQGTISGLEFKNGVASVAVGDSVTLTATATVAGQVFRGWYNNGEQEAFSTANPLTFVANRNRDLVAEFGLPGLE